MVSNFIKMAAFLEHFSADEISFIKTIAESLIKDPLK